MSFPQSACCCLSAPLSPTCSSPPAPQAPSLGRPILYKDVLDCTLKTIRGDAALGLPAEGVAGLYKGLSALLMKMVPCTGIQFASYEAANRMLQAYMA